MELDESLFEDYHHMIVEVDDVDDENLLEHFPSCNKFIQDGLDTGGGVLVHWFVQPRHFQVMSNISLLSTPYRSFIVSDKSIEVSLAPGICQATMSHLSVPHLHPSLLLR